jgi:hypothetical protein
MILRLYALLLRSAAPFQHEPERTELRKMAEELVALERMRARQPTASR